MNLYRLLSRLATVRTVDNRNLSDVARWREAQAEALARVLREKEAAR